ncbi:MAG: solute:Na+ symporter, family [Candidatus Sumerlaeota bacterium]|nr:solute:Na+ symporter, family [Candidatus Sumerlaeota bacterium]
MGGMHGFLLTGAAVPMGVLLVVTAVYVLVIGYLGFRGYKTTKTSTDYLLAGRNIHPYVMAMSYGATFISTSAIVGFGGVAANLGMGLLWLVFLNIFVGIFIAFAVFGKRTRRMGRNLDAHTFPEFLGRRFQSRFIQMFVAAVIFILMPLYAAAVLRGGAEFIKATFAIDLGVATFIFALIVVAYVVAGGLRGVMFTDALQGTIMVAGMLILLVMTYAKVGGFTGGHEALTALAPQMPENLQKGGMVGWTAMPKFGSPIWYSLVTTIILGVGIGVLAQPQLAVRFMTVKSGRELNRAVMVGGLFILIIPGVAYTVGALSNVYFWQMEGKVAIDAAGGNVDQVIPMYINAAMPGWFVVLFMLTLLSAAMSTMSSQFHTMGTSIGRDIFEEGIRKGRDKGVQSILVTRIGIIVAFAVTLVLALWMPGSIVAAATAVFFGVAAAAFLPTFVGCLFTRRITKAGAIAGMTSGFGFAIIWLAFVHAKNAERLGICQLLFDKPALGAYPWSVLDPLVVALPLSILATVIVSLMTKAPDDAHLDRCMAGVGRAKQAASS